MISTKTAYKTQLANGFLKNRVAGKLTLANGTVYDVNDDVILPGSLMISNQSCTDTEFAPGSVYSGELMLTLYISQTVRYTFTDAVLNLDYYLELADGTEQKIPLGIWTVYEAIRNKKTIDLLCVDAMSKFNQSIDSQDDGYSGTAFDIVTKCCQRCGVALKNTSFAGMPNNSLNLVIDAGLMSSYREVLSYASALLCSFATINREGKLQIKMYDLTVADTISIDSRINTDTADYITNYTRADGMFITNGRYIDYRKGTNAGAYIDIGANPLYMATTEDIMNCLDRIKNHFADLQYTPMRAEIVPNPVYELGDVVELENIERTQDSCLSIITKINWTYHGKHELISVGTDPRIKKVKSKIEREIDNKVYGTGEGGGPNYRIYEVAKINPLQLIISAVNTDDDSDRVSNVWDITKDGDKTVYTNMTTGQTIDFLGWED